MNISDALDIISNPNIPCATRIQTALSIGLEPRQRCVALDDARIKLNLLDDPYVELNADDLSDADWNYIDAVGPFGTFVCPPLTDADLESIPF